VRQESASASARIVDRASRESAERVRANEVRLFGFQRTAGLVAKE
jgi:hypothetical protein